MLLRQPVERGDDIGDTHRVHVAERPAGERRKAPAENGPQIAVLRGFQHAFAHAARAFHKLAIEQAFLDVGSTGLFGSQATGDGRRQFRPKLFLAAFGIDVEALGILAALAAKLVHLGNHAIGRAGLVGIAEIGPGLLANLVAEVEPDFVVHRQRADRHAHLLADIFDQRRHGAFAEQRQAFLHIGAKAARGVETAAVVDHDRRLADLHHIIQRLGDGGGGGFLADDDFHQRHAFDG